MALSILLLISFALMIYFCHHLHRQLRYHLPPGPRPWPVVGNLHIIKPVRFRCYAEWSKTYGPIISVWFGSTLNVIVSNSELSKEVLKNKDEKLAYRHRSRSASKFSQNGKDMIWADYGPHYVKVKKVCSLELFSSKRIEALRPIREEEVLAMVQCIFTHCTTATATTTTSDNLGKSLQLRKYIGAVAFNNITRLTFGKRFMNSQGIMIDQQGEELKSIVSNGVKLGASLAMAEHIPCLRWMFPLDEDAFAKHGARRDCLTIDIMNEHAIAFQNNGEKKRHFLDALLKVQHKYDLSEDTISGLLWDMITAGMDTSAVSVEWAMAELIKNPRVQQKAQEELDSVIGHDRLMAEMDFKNLPYLQCVVKEAFRLHPATPLMLPHRANTNVKIGGYDIPKGSNVHVNVWAIARDLNVWKNPSEFWPERFLEDDDVDMKGHDFRLLPFGAGRRACPGAQLGINLVTSMIGQLLHHFKWIPPNELSTKEMDMEENPGLVTYMKTPLEAIPIPRLPQHLYKGVAVDLIF